MFHAAFVENTLFYLQSLILKSQQNRIELVTRPAVTKGSCSDAGAALPADGPLDESGVSGVAALSACVTAGLVFAVGLVIG